nr:uncharacterized protein LOC106016928 [Anas platyrhynchos]
MRGSKEEVFGRATPPRGKQTPGHGVRLKPKEERTDTGVGAPEALRAAPAAWSRLLLGVLGAGRSGRDGSGSRARRPQWLGGSGAPGAGCTPTRSPLAARCGAVGPSASEGAACWDGTGRDGTGRDGTSFSRYPVPGTSSQGRCGGPRGARGALVPHQQPRRLASARPCSARVPAGTDAPRACPSSAKATRAEGTRSRRGGRSQMMIPWAPVAGWSVPPSTSLHSSTQPELLIWSGCQQTKMSANQESLLDACFGAEVQQRSSRSNPLTLEAGQNSL